MVNFYVLSVSFPSKYSRIEILLAQMLVVPILLCLTICRQTEKRVSKKKPKVSTHLEILFYPDLSLVV